MVSKKVLYVEDNASNRFLMEMVFKLVEGIELSMVNSAEEALGLVSTVKPDLILMNHNLPQMSGLEAVEKLKADPEHQHIPVIMLSAEYSSELIKKGKAAGCIAVECKPFEIKLLLEQIISLVGGGQFK